MNFKIASVCALPYLLFSEQSWGFSPQLSNKFAAIRPNNSRQSLTSRMMFDQLSSAITDAAKNFTGKNK